MENQIKRRIDWIDIAKGIAIICTIIGHSAVGKNIIGITIFSFHMPLFFVLSGYTLKKIQLSEIGKATLKDFKRLLIPVFIVLIIETCLKIIFYSNNISVVLHDDLVKLFWGTHNHGISILWFLIALFYSKLFFRIILIVITKYREIFLLSGAFVFSIIGMKTEVPQNLDLVFIAMFFMDAGYLLRNTVDDDSSTIEIVGIVGFFIWTYLIWNKNVYTDLAQRIYPPVAIIAALCGSLCIIQLCKVFQNSGVLNSSLGFLGRYSLELLCIHYLDDYFEVFLKFDNIMNSYIRFSVRFIFRILVLIILVLLKHLFFRILNRGNKSV